MGNRRKGETEREEESRKRGEKGEKRGVPDSRSNLMADDLENHFLFPLKFLVSYKRAPAPVKLPGAGRGRGASIGTWTSRIMLLGPSSCFCPLARSPWRGFDDRHGSRSFCSLRPLECFPSEGVSLVFLLRPPKGHLARSGDIFGCQLRVLLASGG